MEKNPRMEGQRQVNKEMRGLSLDQSSWLALVNTARVFRFRNPTRKKFGRVTVHLCLAVPFLEGSHF